MGLIKSARLSVACEGSTFLSGARCCRKILWLLQFCCEESRPWARGWSGTLGGGGDAVLGEEGRVAGIRLQPAGPRTLRPRGQDSVVLSVDVQGQTSLIFEAG